MASLTVRQLDERLKKLLRLRAARSGRSVEDEVRTILRAATEEADNPLATKLALAEEFNAIGDADGARSLAEEVLAEASGDLKSRAQKLLAEIG